MQTRSPEDLKPPTPTGYIFVSNSGAAKMNDLPLDPVPRTGQAFESGQSGGAKIALNKDLSDDPIWENGSNGGIRLKM